MKKIDFFNIIKELAKSQGIYSRLLRDIMSMSEEEREQAFDNLERMGFTEPLDFILWYESGILPAKAEEAAA